MLLKKIENLKEELKTKIIETKLKNKTILPFINNFRNKSIMDRLHESALVLTKYPDRVPVIIDTTNDELRINKNKFVIPDTLSVSELIYVIRKRINIDSSKAIFIFLENYELLSGNCKIRDLYHKNKSNDGFLYLVYEPENVFGS